MQRIVVAITLGLIFSAGEVSAAGFEVQDFSASATGMANAFTAQADDPSAMAYNPAGIAWQPGTGLMVGAAGFLRNASAKIAAGVASNQGKDPTLVHFYATWMPLDGHWGAGFSVNTPFLLDNLWGSSVFAGQATRTRVEPIRASADIVYAVDSRLALAVGGDYYYSTGDISSSVNNFSGNDRFAIGGHASLMWKFYPGWSLGVMYRFNPTVTISGSNITTFSSAASTQFNLPDSFRAGLAWDFSDALKFEVDGTWTGWSQLSDLNISALNGQLIPLNLQDSFGLMAGVRWSWMENSQLRFGYAFDQAAGRDTGFNARVADANRHRISFGLGGDIFSAHLDFAYILTFIPSRTIAGSAPFNGEYRDIQHTLMLSFSTYF